VAAWHRVAADLLAESPWQGRYDLTCEAREVGRLSAQVSLVIPAAMEEREDVPAEVTGALLVIDRWARGLASPTSPEEQA
jgi:hypothetical protein